LATFKAKPMTDLTQSTAVLTTSEAARRLSLSVTTVQAMVERGDLAAWRTGGGHRRITIDSVDAWVGGRAVPAGRSSEAYPPAAFQPASLRVLYAGITDDLYARCASLTGFASREPSCHRATDALDALLWIERVRPHLLIVSAELPPIGAVALLHCLRVHPQFAQMLAVILTPGDRPIEPGVALRLFGCVCWPESRIAERLTGLIEGLSFNAKA